MPRLGNGPQVSPALKRWWKPRKWRPTRREKWPEFNVPTLVLDLDAEGAKGVRAFDARLDGVPERKSAWRERELRPIKERVAEFERAYEECQSSFEAISADKFHPLHISDVDLLAATLLDSPNAPTTMASSLHHVNNPTTHVGMLRSVLDANGIPRTIRHNTPDTITYMLRRRQLLRGSSSLSPSPDDEVLFSMALGRYATFPEIDRLVAKMIHTPEGCQTLSRLSDELHISLTHAPRVDPVKLLSLLNNVLINFDRHGLHMSSTLLNLGIQTSLQCQAIVTTQEYIKRELRDGCLDESTIYAILNTLLQTSIASTGQTYRAFQLNPATRLTTVFSLLTGYVPSEDQRTVCLRSLISRERVSGFHVYIQCLARLGAFRTIWHEWHATDSKSEDMNNVTKPDFRFNENNYFITAMLEALSKNEDIRSLADSPGFAEVTGRFREDCQLDLIAISKSAKILALPEKQRKENHGSASARVIQWQDLYQIFNEKQIEKAFPALQAFLIKASSFS
ncbi:hypothetical protein F4803DRAFT_527140 [Xylaria telfairii]|nr:hypothetical protein F4803DRAFT_527140 [Xylaria telfairii]